MNVKRISSVSIRRINRQPISTEERLGQLIRWLNANVVNYNRAYQTEDERNQRFNKYEDRIFDINLKIEAIEEYIEETG